MNETTTEIKIESNQELDFKVCFAEPGIFYNIVKTLSGLTSEVVFILNPYELITRGLDPANVAMYNLRMLSSGFLEYNTNNKTCKLGLNLNDLLNILKVVDLKRDMISLESIPSESQKIKLNIIASSTSSFIIPLIDLSDLREEKRPELQFKANALISIKAFKDVIKKAAVVSECLKFSAANNKLVFSADGDITSLSQEVKYPELSGLYDSAESVSKYSIEYLKKLSSFKHSDGDIKIYFSSDYPLVIEYLSVDKYKLEFILAPRIDNN